MAQLTQDATKKHLTQEALLIDTPFLDGSGILISYSTAQAN
jgi:hypothetical protein